MIKKKLKIIASIYLQFWSYTEGLIEVIENDQQWKSESGDFPSYLKTLANICSLQTFVCFIIFYSHLQHLNVVWQDSFYTHSYSSIKKKERKKPRCQKKNSVVYSGISNSSISGLFIESSSLRLLSLLGESSTIIPTNIVTP